MSDAAEPNWVPLRRRRAHELVIEAIEQQVMAGALKVGDSLPPERELAARLQVSRAGVREAVRVLEHIGILTSRQGAGPDSGTVVAASTRDALTQFLRLHVGLANFAIDDVIEARVLLERASAISAAEQGSEALEPVRRSLAGMEAAGADRERFNDADTAFHLAIAEAGGNDLVAALTAAIRGSVRHRILAAMQTQSHWEDVVEQLLSEHRAILAALEAGEPQRAAELSEQHIRSAARTLW